MLGELGKNIEEVRRGDRRVGKDEGWGGDRNWREWDGRGRAAAGMGVGRGVGGWVIPGVVGAVEEFLDDLVGGGDVDLINVVDGGPRGDGERG